MSNVQPAADSAFPKLVLASTSRYRKTLLERLRVSFEIAAPNIDEAPKSGEHVRDLVIRLAAEKARAVAANRRDTAIIIGSDQAASREGHILGKPGSAQTAIDQLLAASGQTVVFYSGVCLLHTSGASESHLDITEVHFRELTRAEVERYVEKERSEDCAGGFKVESLGIALFTRVVSNDPTALIGLPLIWVASALRKFGVAVP